MSKSRNDFPIAGYFGRYKTKKQDDQYEAYYMLKNPATKKPYRKKELVEALLQRKKEYPYLSALIDPWLQKLLSKSTNHPSAIYTMCRTGKTRELALERLKKQCWSDLELLACLLYRPLYQQNFSFGDVTVSVFVVYQRSTLYSDELPDVRTRLLGCLDKTILPHIGDKKLKDLDSALQKKILRAIDLQLRKESAKNSKRGYVRRAYRGLLKAIEGSGWLGCSSGTRLVNLIGMTRERNTQIRNSVRTDHLDNEQRCALFKLLEEPSHLYELFIVSLYYSGLDAAEIAALRFDDFEVLTFRTGCCYTLLVSQRIRKLHQRYSTVSAINEQFPIEKFRRVVLAPWAGEVLVRWLDQLRTLGFSDDEIRQMRLSDETPNGAITGPAEIAARLQPLVKQAGVGDIKVIRTGKNGCSYRETLTLDIQLLGQDARYLAMRCGADTMMLHAMFGGCFTETDEQSYADLLSDSYAIARYLRLRRWSPYSSAPLLNDNKTAIPGFADMPTRYILQVHNSTNHPCTLTLSAPYAIVAKWKSKGVLS